MPKTILYLGGFNFKTENASSIRVIEIAKYFNSVGYNCIVFGKLPKDQFKTIINEVEVVNIELHKKKGIDFSINIANIVEFINGLKNKPIIIAYNYPTLAFYKLQNFCIKNNLELIPDITEWHEIDGDFTVLKWVRKILINLKMKVLNKKANKIILATDFLKNYYNKSNCVTLPFITTSEKIKNTGTQLITDKLVFTFAGTTGNKFSKDRLDIIIKAFSRIHNYDFTFNIIGLTREILMEENLKNEVNILGNKLICHGRLKNKKVKEILNDSDYVVFARDVKRITKVGFPTKIFEAFCSGVPVITNNTYEHDKYIKSGFNGFLINNNSVEDFKNILETVLKLPSVKHIEIKTNCIDENPFHSNNIEVDIIEFLEK